MVSTFDIENLDEILSGEGDWFTAHTLRYLDQVLFKADSENLAKLLCNFPQEAQAIYRHYGWPNDDIYYKFASVGCAENYFGS
jgi:hypothetical protein